MTRAIMSLLVLFLVFASASLQADYQAGLDAYLQGDYATAVAEWRIVVESPPGAVPDAVRAETLYAFGMLFWMGQGVNQDVHEAASWLTLAAELNHPEAQNKLGFLYSLGQGVKQSDFEAFKWWHRAANQGSADAQFNLGVMYRDGLGVKSDPEKSMQWFREAAANGDQVSIGIVAQYDADRKTPSVSISSSPVTEGLIPPDLQGKGENWIRDRNPEHFTIQVIALKDPDKLNRFIEEWPELDPLAIYRQTRYKQPLWVLVQGDYANLNSARLALQSFPQGFQKREKLWIRRFGMVQSLLE